MAFSLLRSFGLVPFFAPTIDVAEIALSPAVSAVVAYSLYAVVVAKGWGGSFAWVKPYALAPLGALINFVASGTLHVALPFIFTLFTSTVSFTPIAVTIVAGIASTFAFGGVKRVTITAVIVAVALASSNATFAYVTGSSLQYIIGLAGSTFAAALGVAANFLRPPPLARAKSGFADNTNAIGFFHRIWHGRTQLEGYYYVKHYKELFDCAAGRWSALDAKIRAEMAAIEPYASHTERYKQGTEFIRTWTREQNDVYIEKENLNDVFSVINAAYDEALTGSVFSPNTSRDHFINMNLTNRGDSKAIAWKEDIKHKWGETTLKMIMEEMYAVDNDYEPKVPSTEVPSFPTRVTTPVRRAPTPTPVARSQPVAAAAAKNPAAGTGLDEFAGMTGGAVRKRAASPARARPA